MIICKCIDYTYLCITVLAIRIIIVLAIRIIIVLAIRVITVVFGVHVIHCTVWLFAKNSWALVYPLDCFSYHVNPMTQGSLHFEQQLEGQRG